MVRVRVGCGLLVAACRFDSTGHDDDVGTSGGPATTMPSTMSTSSGVHVTSSSTTMDRQETAGTSEASATSGETPGWGPFEPPQPLQGVNDNASHEDDPTLTGDRLELYFASTRLGANREDIFVATRSGIDAPWTTPVAVEALNAAIAQTSTPEISTDGLTLALASDRVGSFGLLDVYLATRASRDDDWSAPVRVDSLSSVEGEGAPVFTGDALRAVMCRLVGGTDLRLLMATRNDDADPWSAPFELMMINDAQTNDCGPWIDAEGTQLWWGSMRPQRRGDEDIWMVEVDAGVPLSPPVEVAELNGPTADGDPWLSPDGTTLVFASDRAGSFDLYVATRSLQ